MELVEKVKAIIVAAGKGKRMAANYNKQYILLRDKPVLAHTLKVFQDCLEIDEIIVVVGKDEIDFCRDMILCKYELTKVTSIIEGGKERYDSVYRGLLAAKEDCGVVVIHDGARPFITKEIIIDSIQMAKITGSAIVGVPLKDTIKFVDDKMEVISTPERKKLWAIQTPQTFKYSLIRGIYEEIPWDEAITDDASLVERAGHPVKVIRGNYENIKITTPDDLLYADDLLRKREGN